MNATLRFLMLGQFLAAAAAAGAAGMQPPLPDTPPPSAPPDIAELLAQTRPPAPIHDRERAQVDLLVDGFESTFPGSTWTRLYGPGAVDANWARTTATAATGAASVFCAGFGAAAVQPGVNPYPNNMAAWMAAGPFNLSDAQAAVLNFDYSLRSESGFDFLYVIVTTDPTFTTTSYLFDSGGNGTWTNQTVDLANVSGTSYLGQGAVYIAFVFTSDESNGDVGAFIDNVFLAKATAGPSPTPTATPTPVVTATPTTSPSPTVSPTASATPSPTPTGAIQRQFTIFNDGNATLTVSAINRQNNSPWLTVAPRSPLPLNIAAGQSAVVDVFANKTGLSPGSYTDRLLILSNDPDESPYPGGVNITMTVGGGTPTPSLTPSPTPAIGVQAIVDGILLRAAAGPDANSDGVRDAADIRAVLQ
jgi:hypothetical protein